MDDFLGRSRGGRGVTRGMLPVLALHVANEYYRSGRKPPVTAGLLLANTLIYLRPGPLHRLLPTIDQVWFNPHLIVKNADLKRFFLSAFYHIGEGHLVYNMMSLVWKGIQLESSMGSVEFASMIVSLLTLSQGITLLIARSLALFFDYEDAYYSHYSVGFSGILFAMKVVLNSQSDGLTYLHGMVVPTQHAAWFELVLIQLFVPGASFLGHLGGILAGLLYLHLRRRQSGADPLTVFVNRTLGLVSWPLRFIGRLAHAWRNRNSSRRVGGNNRLDGMSHGVWRCPTCTFDNLGVSDLCDMCSTPRYDFSATSPSRRTGDLSVEELRRRRLERFTR